MATKDATAQHTPEMPKDNVNAEHAKPCTNPDHAGQTYAECGHTPGPWTIFGDCIVTCNHDGSVPLNARIVAPLVELRRPDGAPSFRFQTTDADARLIAAAPDLLAACRFLVEHHLRVCDETCNLMGIDQMRAAIAKATGR